MALTGRVPLLLLLGLVPVVLRPAGSTVWQWLGIGVVLCAVDVAIAPSTRALDIGRRPTPSTRMNHACETVLVVGNPSRRRVRALLRDAWQPSAGATGNRHRVSLAPGDRTLLRTPLLPTRRGDLRAVGVTVRSFGPLGLV